MGGKRLFNQKLWVWPFTPFHPLCTPFYGSNRDCSSSGFLRVFHPPVPPRRVPSTTETLPLVTHSLLCPIQHGGILGYIGGLGVIRILLTHIYMCSCFGCNLLQFWLQFTPV